jgi:hypothetical protein
LQRVAFSKIAPSEFWEMTLREVDNLIFSIRTEQDEREQSVRAVYESARLTAFYTVVATGKARGIKKPADLYPLPWDPKTKAQVITDEQRAEWERKFDLPSKRVKKIK